jgi:hypothetical protein
MGHSKFVCVTYVRTTPQKLGRADQAGVHAETWPEGL